MKKIIEPTLLYKQRPEVKKRLEICGLPDIANYHGKAALHSSAAAVVSATATG
jgi:hypothetical protein